jgi:hypothetical protein
MMGTFPAQPNMQRELIPVPVMDNKQPEPYPPVGFRQQSNYAGNNAGDHDAPFKKKSFDFNRLGPRSKNPANCSLELKKIPQGLNSITHLNNHFSKFGKTVNIQVNYEGDPEAAIVTFSSHAEANAAYRSTEAVLNNRFIKVFWHNGNNEGKFCFVCVGSGGVNVCIVCSTKGKQENVPPRSVKDRLGVPTIVPPNTNKVLNLVQPRADNVTEGGGEAQEKNKPVVNKEENKAQAAAAIKKNQELLAAKEKLKKNQDEQRKEVLKIKNNLRKRKQELLEKQLSQQKILIEKMEKRKFESKSNFSEENVFVCSAARSATRPHHGDHQEDARIHRGHQEGPAPVGPHRQDHPPKESKRGRPERNAGRRAGPDHQTTGRRRHLGNTKEVVRVEGASGHDQRPRSGQEVQPSQQTPLEQEQSDRQRR